MSKDVAHTLHFGVPRYLAGSTLTKGINVTSKETFICLRGLEHTPFLSKGTGRRTCLPRNYA